MKSKDYEQSFTYTERGFDMNSFFQDHIAGDISGILTKAQSGETLILNWKGKLTTASGISLLISKLFEKVRFFKSDTDPVRVSEAFHLAVANHEGTGFGEHKDTIKNIISALRERAGAETQHQRIQMIDDKVDSLGAGILAPPTTVERRPLPLLQQELLSKPPSADKLVVYLNEMEEKNFQNLNSQDALRIIETLNNVDFTKLGEKKVRCLLQSVVPAGASEEAAQAKASELYKILPNKAKALADALTIEDIKQFTGKDENILYELLCALTDDEIKSDASKNIVSFMLRARTIMNVLKEDHKVAFTARAFKVMGRGS
jgi:hypothetical protein